MVPSVVVPVVVVLLVVPWMTDVVVDEFCVLSAVTETSAVQHPLYVVVATHTPVIAV